MNAWTEGADEQISRLLPTLLEESAPFLTGWVLISTYVDDRGDACTAFNAMDGQRRTQTLGMLTHALETERAAIFWEEKPE